MKILVNKAVIKEECCAVCRNFCTTTQDCIFHKINIINPSDSVCNKFNDPIWYILNKKIKENIYSISAGHHINSKKYDK